MPTYSSALLPTTNGLTLGSSALRWTAYIQDIDVAGTPTFTGRTGIKNLEDIRFADQFTGANVTAQIDAALTDISSVGLVVVPSSMGVGNATTIASGKAILDLRSGVPKFFTNNSVLSAAWQLNNDGTVTSQGVKSVTTNPASAGFIRAAKSDAINFRNNANGADVNGLSLDGSDIVQVGGAAGAKTIGAFAVSGALTGITNLSYSGQITSSVAIGTAPFVVTSTTVVPNLSIANINGVTVSGVPSGSGQSLISTSASAAAWSIPSAYKLESAQYTPVTVNTSNALNDLMTFTLPANELAVGQALRLMASGVVTNTTGGPVTYKFEVRIGTTTILDSGTTSLPTASANFHYDVEALLICTAAGSSGTLEVQWVGGSMQTAANLASAIPFTGSAATVSFNTTATNVIASSATMGTSSASASITQRQYLLERLG